MSELSIDQRLFLLRKQKGVNQDTVAEACNISRVSLARYENGTRTPVIDIASRLADYYGVTVDYILGREEAPVIIHGNPGTGKSSLGTMQPERPLTFDGQPYNPWPEDKPETQAIIESILAKLAQLDAEDRKTAEDHIDFLLSRKKGEQV